MIDGILCEGGRLNYASCLTEISRHPIIVDGNKRIALLTVRDYHYHCNYHCGGTNFFNGLYPLK
jgi:hypothetical protein